MARGSEGHFDAMTPPSSSETSHSFTDDETRNGEESEGEESQPQKLFSEKRHYTCGNPRTADVSVGLPQWRLKDKLRTARAALVVCLNIGVDPPDVVKTQPCATLECWVDPFSMPSNKALEAIGRNLQHQFENLNPRMNYKPYLDPSVEDTRKWCIGLRKMVGRECALFYYNGHGVPKPTRSGEIWVFNRGYSQYIPVSIQDLQLWLGSPCVFVWDCSAAGNIVTNFLKFAEQKDQQARMNQQQHSDGHAQRPFMDCIQLAACAADEVLPMTPELPADVFTACLTSPIEMALRFFALRNPLPSAASNFRKGVPHLDNVMQLPGDLKDRRTPLGELNWIFTAVTDTIAWTTFPRDIFRRLFRQDLMVAALFRNFLLAERIMRNYHCTPQSYPPLPPSHNHPLWNSWDLAVDSCLAQLPQLRIIEEQRLAAQQEAINGGGSQVSDPPGPYQYVPSSFFGDHLTAFQVWLTRGAALSKTGITGDKVQPIYFNAADSSDESDVTGRARAANEEGFRPRRGILIPRRPPDQLPIILQVLLSQTHRLRALILLSQFMDLGPWAVHLALAIGIFPYVQKLLQSPAQELKPVLVFVWARLLAVDRSCREDLLRDDGYMYFVNILSPHTGVYIPNSAEHRAMCAFILSIVARDHPEGQMQCLRQSVFHMCLIRLDDPDYLLRQWSALCIAQLWDGNDDAKKYGIDQGAQDKLSVMMSDHSPTVRAAAMYALAIFLGASGSAIEGRRGGGGTGCRIPLQDRDQLRLEVAIATGATLAGKEDASPMVRKELVVLLSCLVNEWRGWFVVAAWVYWEDHGGLGPLGNPTTREQRAAEGSLRAAHAQREWADRSGGDARRKEEMRVVLSSFFTIYCTLLELSVDPYPEVGTIAQTVVDYIMALLLESPFAKLPSSDFPKAVPPRQTHYPHQPRSATMDEKHPALSRVDTASSHITNTLRRTTSFAATLKNIATGYAFPTSLDSPGAGPSSLGTHDPDPGTGGKRSDVPRPHLVISQYQSPYSPTTPQPEPRTPARTSTSMSVPSSPRVSSPPVKETHLGQSRFTTDPRSFHHGGEPSAADIIEALVEEDNERLRARKQRHPSHSHGARSSDGTESSATGTTSVMSLNTGENLADVLPLKSKYFDWSCEYFLEPQMRQSEEDEPGSVTYNELMWRRQRNEKILYSTDHQAGVAPHCPWDRPVSSFAVDGPPVRMKMHQFDPHIAIIDDSTSLSIWDWSKKKKIVTFNNGNPAGSAITGVHFINEDAQTMVLTASAEGTVRIFRNYDVQRSHEPMEIVTSWRALNHTIPLQKGSGLVCDWQQESGLLACGGDSRVIRVWDGFQELCLAEVFTQMDTCVTSIAFDPDGPNAFLATSADGRLCLYDRRIGGHASLVRNWHRHQAWIESVHWQSGGDKSIMTASVDGEVRLWDVRDREGVGLSGKKWQPHGNALANFAVHPKAAVFAATSAITSTARPQSIVIHSLPPVDKPSILSRFTVPTNQNNTHGQTHVTRSPFFTGPSSLVFHPNEMLYATGGPDGIVRMFGCKLKESQEEDVPRGAYERMGRNGLNGHYSEGVRLASVRSTASSG